MFPGLAALAVLSLLKGLALLVSYLSNNAFPQPLSEEAESHNLLLLQQGDLDARNTLIEHNLRLVAHVIRKFDNTGEDMDDLISIGTIGLIKAINTFDLSKGVKLATYAARCIENEILMHLRATKKHRGEVSLHDPIGVDKEGNEISLSDILGTDPNAVSDLVERTLDQQTIYKQIQKLSKRERRVLEERYGLMNGLRKTQRDIARKMGISRSYVSRIEKRAIEKLIDNLNY